MQQVKGNALQGSMEVNGSYSTKQSKHNPDIDLAYNVQNLDVQQTFNAFNTVQKLMPIGQFLSGKISSQLKLQGKLGKDMMPVLSSLNGDGNLLLIEGFLKKFAPVDQLASQLNVSQLKDISLKDIKSYFSFENGRVKINPFNVKLSNMNMAIAGSHGFDQSLDYTMQLALPRSIMGTQANSLINNLVKQASNKGIPVNVSDSVHLQVLFGGNMLKPTYKTDLQETASRAGAELKDQAATLVKNKVDTVKNTVKDSLAQVKQNVTNSLKDQLAKKLSGQKDTTTATQDKPAQSTGKQAEQTLKNTVNGLFKKKSQ
ncbi:MAG TPA: AsmA-like C-terminal region-containing protein, partial [Chitinophaga sp.]